MASCTVQPDGIPFVDLGHVLLLPLESCDTLALEFFIKVTVDDTPSIQFEVELLLFIDSVAKHFILFKFVHPENIP